MTYRYSDSLFFNLPHVPHPFYILYKNPEEGVDEGLLIQEIGAIPPFGSKLIPSHIPGTLV